MILHRYSKEHRLLFISCISIALLLALPVLPAAQNITGRISATVKDSSGGVILGVSVTVTNEGTNVLRTAITDELGFYVMTSLPVGMYSVAVEQPGFRKMRRTGLVHLKLWDLPPRPPPAGIAFSDTITDYGFFDGLVS